jgi:octaprenyl-diphosphate synthase
MTSVRAHPYISGRIKPLLKQVEDGIASALSSKEGLIEDIGAHLLESRGKLIRPSLLLLSADISGADDRESVTAGTCIELVHMATLIHDDVIDGGTIRRGRSTVNSRWNVKISVVMGDFLFSSALAKLSSLGNPHASDILAVTTHRISAGEMYQLERSGDFMISEDEYLYSIQEKTASLLSASCEIGVVLGQWDDALRKSVADYGMNVGMAFQIVDDVLDFVGDQEVLGKAVGNDLAEGKATLPLIYALREAEPEARQVVFELLRSDALAEDTRRTVLEFIHENHGIEYARTTARYYLDAARESLGSIDEGPTKAALSEVLNHVENRER